jgi:hypothetical protein
MNVELTDKYMLVSEDCSILAGGALVVEEL